MRAAKLLVFMLAIGLAIAADQLYPVHTPQPAAHTVRIFGGQLVCPIATMGDGSGTLSIANVDEHPSSVRVTILPAAGARLTLPIVSLPPGVAHSISLSKVVDGPSGAIVEYTGGTVIATHEFLSKAGGDAGTCQRVGGSVLAVAPLRTLNAESLISVVNPGAADAEFSIELQADTHHLLPENLHDRIVPARSRRDFRVGDFAFDSHAVIAIVRVSNGRVAVEGLVRSARGVMLVGATQPSQESIAITGRSGPGAVIALGPTEDDDTALDARLVSARAQGAATGLPPTLGRGTAQEVSMPDRGKRASGAMILSSSIGSPFVAGSRWEIDTRYGRDEAGLESVSLARRWAGVLASPVSPASPYAIIVNPGPETRTVHVTIADQTSDLTVPGGRIAEQRLAPGAGTALLSIEADGPVALVLETTSVDRRRHVAYAMATPGTPLDLPPGAATVIDPTAGIAVRRAV